MAAELELKVKHLQVDSVQALAAAAAAGGDVPERYVLPEPISDANGAVGYEVPVVDLERLLDPELAGDETAKLSKACSEWGIFHLINHGMNKEVMKNMKRDAQDFLSFALDVKKSVAIDPDGDFQGFGQYWIMSEDQKIDWVDALFLYTLPVASRNLRYWPANPASFRESLNDYSVEVNKIARRLLEPIAGDLDVEPDILLGGVFKDGPVQWMRLNHYPPCPKPSKVMGLSAHTDGVSALTFLLQVTDDVPGLQVQKDGRWYTVHADLPDALVVNVSDILEILSNGKYKSAVHRAIVNSRSDRISIASFILPQLDCTIGPLPELAGEEGNGTGIVQPRYKSISFHEYMNTFLSSKLSGNSLLQTMKLE